MNTATVGSHAAAGACQATGWRRVACFFFVSFMHAPGCLFSSLPLASIDCALPSSSTSSFRIGCQQICRRRRHRQSTESSGPPSDDFSAPTPCTRMAAEWRQVLLVVCVHGWRGPLRNDPAESSSTALSYVDPRCCTSRSCPRSSPRGPPSSIPDGNGDSRAGILRGTPCTSDDRQISTSLARYKRENSPSCRSPSSRGPRQPVSHRGQSSLRRRDDATMPLEASVNAEK